MGNETPIAPRTLNQYDAQRYGGPGAVPHVYGYGFFGINF